jgi:hypothetical protein
MSSTAERETEIWIWPLRFAAAARAAAHTITRCETPRPSRPQPTTVPHPDPLPEAPPSKNNRSRKKFSFPVRKECEKSLFGRSEVLGSQALPCNKVFSHGLPRVRITPPHPYSLSPKEARENPDVLSVSLLSLVRPPGQVPRPHPQLARRPSFLAVTHSFPILCADPPSWPHALQLARRELQFQRLLPNHGTTETQRHGEIQDFCILFSVSLCLCG